MIHLRHDNDFLYAYLTQYAKQINHKLENELDENNQLTYHFYTQYYIVAEKLIQDLQELQRKIRIKVNEIKLNKTIDSFGLDE